MFALRLLLALLAARSAQPAVFFDNVQVALAASQIGAVSISSNTRVYAAFVFPSTDTEYTITSVALPIKASGGGVGSNKPWFVSLFAWDAATNRTQGAAIGAPFSINCGGGCQTAAWSTTYTVTGGAGMIMNSTCASAPAFYALVVRAPALAGAGDSYTWQQLQTAPACVCRKSR